jgi:predicted nucleic acid-binding protein
VLFVDSSAWIALMSASDGFHAAADVQFRDAVRARTALLTTNLVLAEVHRLILHRVGPAAARLALDRVAASSVVLLEHATASHHETARRWLTRLADQRITYTDAVSFAVMTGRRCRAALTFDADFARAGFEVRGRDG